MYVFHCNAIPEREVLAAIERLVAHGRSTPIAASDVLLELNRYGKCLGCFPLIEDLVRKSLGANQPPKAPSHRTPIASVKNLETPLSKPRRRGGSLARRARE